MYCPEHIVFNRWIRDRWYVALTMYWHDVPRHLIPWRVWLNPLRYELSFSWPDRNRFFRINTNGRAAYVWSNFRTRLRDWLSD